MGDLCDDQDRNPVLQEYLGSLPSMHLEPLWDRLGAMVPPSPNPVCVPYLWEYKKTLPYLAKAGQMVPEEEAERRVLMLINPAMSKSHTKGS
jgi:gentisate 1,2-dioxygenase